VAFSPDGKTALFNAPDHSLTLANVASGQTIRRFSGYSDAINSAAFSPDGRYILAGVGSYTGASRSAEKDSSIRLWEASAGRDLRRFVGHTDAVMSVAFSPNAQYMISGSVDGSVRLWDIASGNELRSLFDHNSGVFSVNFSGDGKYV